MNCVIIIPIYKLFSDLTGNEIKSIVQCLRVLNKHHITFICQESFSDIYLYNELAIAENKIVEFKQFKKVYFDNIEGYNRLLLSKYFYDSFCKYDNMLIYQTDAYVFSDQLDFWCEQGYDYIGAPWFDGYSTPSSTKLIGVGNGGFSLRNIQKSIEILRRYSKVKIIFFLYKSLKIKRLSKIITLIKKININSRIIESGNIILDYSNIKEDGFWAEYISSLFLDFKVATIDDATRFSFEVNPKLLFELNEYQLPFGCHAWEKYDYSFWKNYIN
jgi:hypothetical protein